MSINVVFLSNNSRYLTDRVYIALAEYLGDFELHYLDSDFVRVNYVRSKEADEGSLSDAGIRVHNNFPNYLETRKAYGLGSIVKFFNLRVWRYWLLDRINKLSPAVIICISDTSFSYKVLKQVYGDKIPFVLIQHGQIRKFYSSNPKYSRFYQLALGVDLSVKSDVVFNEDIDTKLLFWAPKWTTHYPKEKTILFTGPIIYDKIFRTDYSGKRKESRKKMGLDKANRIVIIALNKKKHIGIDGFMKFADAYKYLFQYFADTTFILKVHPLEEMAFCEKAFDAKMYENVRLTKNSDWEVLLAAGDTFVTHWSSTLYNSIAAGLPTILFSPFGDNDFSNRNLDSFQFLAKNKEMLSQLVSESFTNRGKKNHLLFRERFVSEQMLCSDGQSAVRAADAIREICHSGNSISYNDVNNG